MSVVVDDDGAVPISVERIATAEIAPDSTLHFVLAAIADQAIVPEEMGRTEGHHVFGG